MIISFILYAFINLDVLFLRRNIKKSVREQIQEELSAFSFCLILDEEEENDGQELSENREEDKQNYPLVIEEAHQG
jgi:hypothetical protein